MAKAVKLLTTGQVELVELPGSGSLLNWLYNQIGCTCIENVYPRGLKSPYLMVVDGEFLVKGVPYINFVGSWLYETHKHGQPICGTVLIMQRVMTNAGPDFGGIPDKAAEKIARQAVQILPEAVHKIRKKLGPTIIDD